MCLDFVDQADDGVAWIGIINAHANGTWSWTDGTPVGYTNWGQGEPAPGTYAAYIAGESFSDEDPPEVKGYWYGQDLDLYTMGICVLPAKGAPTRPPTTTTKPAYSGKCDPGWEYYPDTNQCYRNVTFF